MPEQSTPKQASEGDSGGVRSVQRAIEILSLLTEDQPTVTVRQIVDATRLPKTTVLRIVQTLEHSGLLVSTDAGYLAGPALWRWAYLAQTSWEVPPEARALMRDLVARQRETVNIYVIHNIERICVAQEESPMPLRHVVGVGDRLPLWAGASSKVLLRDAPEQVLETIATSSPTGASHLATLKAGIHEAAEHGYSVSHGERESGLSAVAVPVISPKDDVIASLSFSGPTSRFADERINEMLIDLRQGATHLADRGFDHPLRSSFTRSR